MCFGEESPSPRRVRWDRCEGLLYNTAISHRASERKLGVLTYSKFHVQNNTESGQSSEITPCLGPPGASPG